jgi:hypothetical protein
MDVKKYYTHNSGMFDMIQFCGAAKKHKNLRI